MGVGSGQFDTTGSTLGLTTHPVGSREAIEWDGEPEQPGLCCLQGCLAGTAVGCSIFVALPTGIILVVLASNNDDTTLLVVGCLLVTLPVIILLVVTALCFNQNKLPCQRRKFKKSQSKVGHMNPVVHTTTSSGQFSV